METLARKTNPIRMRNYGRIIQDMIDVTATEEDQQLRERKTIYIAQCMRQKNMIWNKDQDTSIQRIKDDIYQLSDGRLLCDFEAFDQELQKPIPRPENREKKHK